MVQEPFKTNSSEEETTEYQFQDPNIKEPSEEGIVYDQEPAEMNSAGKSENKGEAYSVVEGDEGEMPPPSSTMPPASPSKSNKGRIILFIVAAIVILLVVYKIFNLLTSGSMTKPATSLVTPVQQEKLIAPLPKKSLSPAPIVSPVVTQPAAVSSIGGMLSSPKTEDIPNKITQLQKGYDNLVHVLNDQNATNKNQLNDVNQRVEDLQNNINDLKGMIQNVSQQLQKQEMATQIANVRQAQVQKAQNAKVRSQKLYFVEAVIPGRAWIRNREGSVLTVTVGDSIKGYGKVLSINSYNGTVMTSEGGPIYYGVND